MYEIKGNCKQCGKCCKRLIYTTQDQNENIPPIIGWCENLDIITTKCKIHENKPNGCKSFPTIDNFVKEEIIAGCGYYLKNNMGD